MLSRPRGSSKNLSRSFGCSSDLLKCSLEHELQAHIDDSAASIELFLVQEVRIGDAGIARGVDSGVIDTDNGKHARIRKAELTMVEDVEELGTELQGLRLIEPEAL